MEISPKLAPREGPSLNGIARIAMHEGIILKDFCFLLRSENQGA